MQHNVRTQFQRFLQVGACKGIVHTQHDAAGLRVFSDPRDVTNSQQRIGGGF